MAIKEKKAIGLYWLFLRYLAAFFLFSVVLFFALILLLNIGINSGFILPANYGEQAVKQVEEQIAESEEFDESQIPFPCTYVLLDDNRNVLSSNMAENKIEKAQEALGNSATYSNERYLVIQREDSVCIVSYDFYPHFSSAVLHRLFPNPELLGLILFFTGFLAIAVMIAVSFGRKLRTELVPIMEATDAIKRQNLHFDVNATRIREFNTVLDSIKDMSVALEDSLKQQWSLEQHRKMQISAITHDIKTPLTIIKGNTELLQESEIASEDKELLEYIHTSSDKIEKYLSLLMAAAKAEKEDDFKPKIFSVDACMKELETQAKAHCKAKNITLMTEKEALPEVFFGDRELIIRAVSNILDNAVEYTSKEGSIEFAVSGAGNQLTFSVTDSGKGFSQDSLRFATQEFYTEQKERSGKHYGLGLFIAKSVAQKHNGELLLANKSEGHGAVVTLIIREINSSS